MYPRTTTDDFRREENMETVEERIKQNAFLVGVSISKLPDYCGGVIGKTALADALAAGKLAKITADTIEEVLEVMWEMKKRTGLPIDWSQSASIRPVVEERLREYRDADDPTPRYIFFVRTSSVSFFEVRRGGQVITTPSESQAAAFLTWELAHQCKQALKKFDVESFTDRFTNTMQRKQSTLTTDLAQLGFE